MGWRRIRTGVGGLAVCLIAGGALTGCSGSEHPETRPRPSPSSQQSKQPAGKHSGRVTPTLNKRLAAQSIELGKKQTARLTNEAAAAQAAANALHKRASTSKFTMVDFNNLAASMNDPGKRNHNWPKYPYRTAGMVSMLTEHHADLATFQEFQRPQHDEFMRLAGSTYDIYPSPAAGQTPRAIVWRRSRFGLVRGELMTNPWFFGRPDRRTPRVLLRDRASGVQFWVSTYHNPPDTMGNQSRWRHGDMFREINSTNALIVDTHQPVIVSGDMNDRSIVFCTWTGNTAMHAAAGGDHQGACQPPPRQVDDWIFGSPQVAFANYNLDPSSRVRRISDHMMLSVDVTVSR